jgi:hypothetical protein
LGLSFTIAAGPPQRSHSRVRVLRDSHILLSQIRAPRTWKTRSLYLYPPRTGRLGYNLRHWVLFSSPPRTLSTTEEVVRVRFRVRITSRLAIYRQSVRLGVKHLETHDHRSFFFF